MLSQDNTYKKSTSKKGKYSESFPTATIMMEIKATRNSLTQRFNCLCRYFYLHKYTRKADFSVPSLPQTGSNSFFAQGDGKTSSHWLIRGYVLMILPQVHLRNGE